MNEQTDTGITNTAPITNTSVANTAPIIGAMGGPASGVAAQKKPSLGQQLLDPRLDPLDLAKRLWRVWFPQLRRVKVMEVDGSNLSIHVKNFGGWFGWTQRATEVYLRAALLANHSAEERIALFIAALPHERDHVIEFRKSGNRPTSLSQMVVFESSAYPTGIGWINNSGRSWLLKTFGNKKGDMIFDLVKNDYLPGLRQAARKFKDKAADIKTAKKNGNPLTFQQVRTWMEGNDSLPKLDASWSETKLLHELYGY